MDQAFLLKFKIVHIKSLTCTACTQKFQPLSRKFKKVSYKSSNLWAENLRNYLTKVPTSEPEI